MNGRQVGHVRIPFLLTWRRWDLFIWIRQLFLASCQRAGASWEMWASSCLVDMKQLHVGCVRIPFLLTRLGWELFIWLRQLFSCPVAKGKYPGRPFNSVLTTLRTACHPSLIRLSNFPPPRPSTARAQTRHERCRYKKLKSGIQHV